MKLNTNKKEKEMKKQMAESLTLENPWTKALIEMIPAEIISRFDVDGMAQLVDEEILYELEGLDEEEFVVALYNKIGRERFSNITLGA